MLAAAFSSQLVILPPPGMIFIFLLQIILLHKVFLYYEYKLAISSKIFGRVSGCHSLIQRNYE